MIHNRFVGAVLIEPPLIRMLPSWDAVPGRSGQHPEGTGLAPNTSREALEQLVELGYIERPGGDLAETVAKTQRELDYNLAMAYMDAGLHGEAAPLLARLYQQCPLEFRFGVQLALCLHALGRIDDLDLLIGNLNRRWRKAAERVATAAPANMILGSSASQDIPNVGTAAP